MPESDAAADVAAVRSMTSCCCGLLCRERLLQHSALTWNMVPSWLQRQAIAASCAQQCKWSTDWLPIHIQHSGKRTIQRHRSASDLARTHTAHRHDHQICAVCCADALGADAAQGPPLLTSPLSKNSASVQSCPVFCSTRMAAMQFSSLLGVPPTWRQCCACGWHARMVPHETDVDPG